MSVHDERNPSRYDTWFDTRLLLAERDRFRKLGECGIPVIDRWRRQQLWLIEKRVSFLSAQRAQVRNLSRART